jgi:hypothetical protein
MERGQRREAKAGILRVTQEANLIAPSRGIVERSQDIYAVRDELGRNLGVRRLNALQRLRLLKAAGPVLSQNDAWLNIAALACSVVEVDGVPRVAPGTEAQIETLVSELGDAGLRAVADVLMEQPETSEFFDGSPEGNAPGTPS